VRDLIRPTAARDEVTALLASSSLDALAATGSLILHRERKVSVHRIIDDRTPFTASGLWPIRRIGTYRGAGNRVGMYAVDLDGYRIMIEVESWLEMCHLRDQEFNFGATSPLTQPFLIRWAVGEKFAWRVPDILGRDPHGLFVADVKPEDSRTDYDLAMFELTAATLAPLGIRYRLLGAMSKQKRINLRALAAQRWPHPLRDEAASRARLAARSSLGGVIDSAGGHGIGTAAALHLLTRELFTDLDLPLTYGSPVEWRKP
jgi:hypothetical protein